MREETFVSRTASPWLTLPQAAQYLQMDLRTLRQLVYSGAIPSRKRNEKRIFVKADWLDDYMEQLPSGAKVPEVLRNSQS